MNEADPEGKDSGAVDFVCLQEIAGQVRSCVRDHYNSS
jgi:hypothetical protein